MITLEGDHKRTIYVYPYEDDGNEYSSLIQGCWRRLGYSVRPFQVFPRSAGEHRSDRTVVLGWLEDWTFAGRRPPVLAFIILCLWIAIARCWARNLVWVRHNLTPNVANRAPKLRTASIWVLGKLADTVVTHRPLNNVASTYVPHPLYNERVDILAEAGNRDIEFILFGHIRPSKRIQDLLNVWPKDLPLQIAGKSSSLAYANQLRTIIEQRALKCDWDDRLLEISELSSYLLRSRKAIIFNNWDSVIVSGACYHAMSYGVGIITSDGEFPRFLQKSSSGVRIFSNLAEFQDILSDREAVDPKVIFQSVVNTNGLASTTNHWKPLLTS